MFSSTEIHFVKKSFQLSSQKNFWSKSKLSETNGLIWIGKEEKLINFAKWPRLHAVCVAFKTIYFFDPYLCFTIRVLIQINANHDNHKILDYYITGFDCLAFLALDQNRLNWRYLNFLTPSCRCRLGFSILFLLFFSNWPFQSVFRWVAFMMNMEWPTHQNIFMVTFVLFDFIVENWTMTQMWHFLPVWPTRIPFLPHLGPKSPGHTEKTNFEEEKVEVMTKMTEMADMVMANYKSL